MPAHRKSLAELTASGSTAKDPQRFRNRTEPPAPKAPLDKIPKHLDAEQKKVWREIVSNAPEGLLGSCDSIAIELCVRLVCKMRNSPDKWTSTDAGQLANIMGKLGGTPGDRQRLNVVAPVEKTVKDELSELD
jgi:phage terminase small subunit